MGSDTGAPVIAGSVRPKPRHRLLARVLDWWLTRLETKPGRRLPRLLSQRLTASSRQRWYRPALIRALQEIRLRRTIGHVADRSPFYRRMFADSSTKPRDIRSLDDLRRLPFTTPADIADADQFLCLPADEIAHVYTTSGTTREPKRVYYSARDFDRMVNLPALLLRSLPSGEPIVCLIAHAQGQFILNGPPQAVIERAGGRALPVGQPLPAETLKQIAHLQPNVMMTSPSYMASLTREAKRAGVHLPLSYILLDGELLTLAQVELFSAYWGARVINGYGLTEIPGGAMGRAGCQALHLNEIQFFTEIVDPESGQPCPKGELVFTTLTREAMPLLRYRTGDGGRWALCGCGSPVPAIVIEGRLDDTVVVAATNLYAPLVAEAVAELEGANGVLELLVDHVEHVDRLTLRVGVESGHGLETDVVAKSLFALYPDLEADFRAQAFELKVEAVENLHLGPKALRVRDLRH